MMKFFICLLVILLTALYGLSQQVFQLAPPYMKYNSVFFKEEIKVSLTFAQEGTIIRYTTDGKEPDEQADTYKGPITVSKTFTTIKAKVFGKDFLPSETMQATFVKDGLSLREIQYPLPDERYTGEGENTLLDNKGGIASYTHRTWLGFRQDTVSLVVSLSKKQKVSSVLFNLLQDYGSWIFFPQKAEVYSKDNLNGSYIKLGEMNMTPDEHNDVNVSRPFVINFKKVKTSEIKLQLFVLKHIPVWHPGKGQSSWIFIDEVKLY